MCDIFLFMLSHLKKMLTTFRHSFLIVNIFNFIPWLTIPKIGCNQDALDDISQVSMSDRTYDTIIIDYQSIHCKN